MPATRSRSAARSAFATWIFLGGIFSQRFDPIALTAAQMLVIAVCAVPVVLIGGLGHVTGEVVVAALVTGVACSALAFSLQLWGQRYVEPSRAAVILLFEPVVAGFVGYLVGERLGVAGLPRRDRDLRRHRARGVDDRGADARLLDRAVKRP